MPWEKSSSELVDLFQQVVPAGPNLQHKKMFGYLCAFVNGNLFTGLFQRSMIFRLSPSDRAAFLDQPGTADFEPMPGHKMKSYALFRDPFTGRDEALADWAKCVLQFASKLPPKKKAASRPATKNGGAARKKKEP